jgi:uncharacterized membrane protein
VGGGLVGGTLAAVLDLIDFLSIRRVREHAAGWIHFIGNSTVLVLSLAYRHMIGVTGHKGK